MAKHVCQVTGCDVLPFRNADGSTSINIYGDTAHDIHVCAEIQQSDYARYGLFCDPYEPRKQARGRPWGATLYLSRDRNKNGTLG